VRRLIPALVAAVAVVSGACGSAKATTLDATADRLRDVESGELKLSYTATAQGGRPVGFAVEGPFSLPSEEGETVEADLRFTRLLGEVTQERRFVATGGRAWVEVEGEVSEVPTEALGRLRAGKGGDGALGGLGFADWAQDPTTADGPDGTEVVTGPVDPVAAFNDLAAMAAGLGSDEAPRPLEGDGAERLRKAVRSAQMKLVTGAEDHMLRSLRVSIELAPAAAERLADVLGPLAGVELVLEVNLARANQPVKIEPPA
jgi:hypothetical protein